jgi:hypothetical protein
MAVVASDDYLALCAKVAELTAKVAKLEGEPAYEPLVSDDDFLRDGHAIRFREAGALYLRKARDRLARKDEIYAGTLADLAVWADSEEKL